MKNAVKPITLVLILTMIISVFAAYPVMASADSAEGDPTKYKMFYTEGGSVSVELEKVVINPGDAKVENVKEASGRSHVKFVNTDLVTPDPDTPGAVGFDVTFDQDGKYFIWVRFLALSGGSDTIWIDYGSAEYRTGKTGYLSDGFAGQLSTNETDYRWDRMGSIQKKAGETQKVRIRTREPNCVLDKIIITKHAGFKPEGTGKLPNPDEIGKPAKMPEDRYPIPTVTPPPSHPRVLFTASDIPKIKENMNTSEMTPIVKIFDDLRDKEYTGQLPDKDPNYDATGLETISAKALDYALFGNEENGKNAISAIKNYASSFQATTLGDKTRNLGHVIKILGQVYDWCYPLLTDKDKEELMLLAQTISMDMEVGFPPDGQGMLCGHGAEWQLYRDWLTMAIAAYDEYPDAYNMVAGKIFSPDSVEYRNWWNKSHTHSQGTCYGVTRYMTELYGHVLIKNMSGAELFNEEDLVSIAYEWIYRRRPDGAMMIDGDDNVPNSHAQGSYIPFQRDTMFLAAAVSKSPILKREFFYQGGFTPEINREALSPTDMLILNDPNVDTNTAIGTLPLTAYHASPVGEMVARTGWDMGTKSDDVIATMTLAEYNPMNHGHYESGHFMIYYKGPLANDTGWYEKHSSDQNMNYATQTAAHNSLLIGSSYNPYGNQNQGIDGPQKTGIDTAKGKNFYWIPKDWAEYQADKQNRFAEIMAHEFGPDLQYPEYSYLAGDIAQAYTSDYDDNVNEAVRHMIFMPTGNEKNPAVFVVFDKIDTKETGHKKSFLLHSEEEPEVSGNITTIKRTENDYNGKLINQTLLPSADALSIEKVGGAEFDEKGKVINETDKRFWNKGKNWSFLQDSGLATGADSGRTLKAGNSIEHGWGRVEISPKNTNKVDYLLNVMYVGNADDNLPVEKATLIETNKFAGAKIFDRVAIFNKNKARTKDDITFTIPGNEQALKINVAGLEAGTWNINVNGTDIGTQIASKDGGMIYFTAPAGSVTLKYTNSDANKQFTKSAPPQLEGVTVFFNKNFLYSDVPPTIRDGRTLIPMRALLEAMDAEVSWDEATATATAVTEEVEIKITENQKTAYVDGNPVELDVPAMIIDGRFVIPVRFIAENLGAKVSWDEFAQKVIITVTTSGQKLFGIPNQIRIIGAEQSGAEANAARQIAASYDGEHGSYWGVSSDGHDAWGVYDLGRVRALDKVMLSFMSSHARKYKFDIEVSQDGVNYTPVITGKETNGETAVGNFESFDLGGASGRYVRYRGYGNSVNKWNSMCEIVFTEKK